MAEIFISYKSERRAAAEHLAAVLERHGWSVWFDYQLVKGRDFGHQIDSKVRSAKALVALWCTLSVGSRWVAEEVDLAHELGILVPVKIEPCDLPVGFRRQDYIDLSAWDGGPRSHLLDPLMDALEQRIGRAPTIDQKGLRDYEATWRRFGAQPLKSLPLQKALEAVEGDRRLPGREPSSGKRTSKIAQGELSELMDQMRALTRRQQEIKVAVAQGKMDREAGDRATLASALAQHAMLNTMRQKMEEITALEQEERARRREQTDLSFLADLRAKGGIDVRVGDGSNDKTTWIKPGSGEVFRDIPNGPEMVVVPAGEFVMGSPSSEPRPPWHKGEEEPQHRVTIAKPFAVGRFAVTFDEWEAIYRTADGVRRILWSPQSWGRGRLPAINVSWEDANAFAACLSDATGKAYRLLSEAEWEYCCRAGTTTRYWWGSAISTEQANYAGSAPVTVDNFAPNPWGIHQMHGNVWEWCADSWHPNYQGAPQDGSVRSGGDANRRVVRGGSWASNPVLLRSAYRDSYNPGNEVGFRIAGTL